MAPKFGDPPDIHPNSERSRGERDRGSEIRGVPSKCVTPIPYDRRCEHHGDGSRTRPSARRARGRDRRRQARRSARTGDGGGAHEHVRRHGASCARAVRRHRRRRHGHVESAGRTHCRARTRGGAALADVHPRHRPRRRQGARRRSRAIPVRSPRIRRPSSRCANSTPSCGWPANPPTAPSRTSPFVGGRRRRISRAITATLAEHWYDEADLYTHATKAIDAGVPDGLEQLIVHLPQELSGLALAFVRTLGRSAEVHVIVQVTGLAEADRDAAAIAHRTRCRFDVRSRSRAGTSPATETTHADERRRRSSPRPTPTTRSASRCATSSPRRVPAHRSSGSRSCGRASGPTPGSSNTTSTTAEIPWNGRPGTTTAERLAPRLVLDLLDVDRRGLRRRSVFDLLADVPGSRRRWGVPADCRMGAGQSRGRRRP